MVAINDIKNTIVNANSLEYLKEIPDESIDLIVTSPPYDNLRDYDGKTPWNYQIFKGIADQIHRVLKKGGVCVWVVGDKVENGKKTLTSFRHALYFDEIGMGTFDVIIY